ncbi:MAG: hypothetical protein WAL25_09915 [Acidimicrobiia bacterium]
MGTRQIDVALASAEAAVRRGESLAGTGFWSAVGEVKRRPELVDSYANRIAAIDSAAFADWALLRVPLAVGTSLMALATLVGVALIGVAYFIGSELWKVIVFYLGLGVLLVSTHGLAHLVVGRLVGIRFTNWFIGTIKRPQPGVKVDYATYLRAPAESRAWMHASGAIFTKVVPFLLVGAGLAADLPMWAVWGLFVVGVAAIATDILWSTDASDWKRFSRERSIAQESSSERGIEPSR